MVRDYKKRTKSYSPEDLINVVTEVKNRTLTLRKAHQKYEILLGTLSNKRKVFSNAGHPTVFRNEVEVLMAQHFTCLGE